MSSALPASVKSARELLDLTGRTAIITGGSVGLGRQMAEGLAEMGANLVLCARKKERCVQAAEELQKLGVNLACNWAMHNIQVNAIASGWFPTNMSQVLIERNKTRSSAGFR